MSSQATRSKAASTRLGWPLVINGAGHVAHIEQSDRFVSALQAVLGGPRPADERNRR